MTNSKLLERFNQTHAHKIDKLFWIAGQTNSSDLKSFLEEIDDRDFEEMFPEDIERIIKYREHDIAEVLIEADKLGVIAEVHYPRINNVRYDKKGNPIGWSSHPGTCRIGYVYAETLSGLTGQIEKQGNKIFAEYIAKDKSKKEKVNG